MKIDLHVHSKFSKRPSQWILQKLGCPESFTDPRRLYDTARERGMDMVTITDHNRIDGALSIAHLPGTFVSEEITAYFPEDRCKIHVLALNITEAQHKGVQEVRENIYELVDYLRAERIHHICAHPLYGVNDRLSVPHFERLLLLFKNFEMNGARDGQQISTLRLILSLLNKEVMEQLADKHKLDPYYAEPWRKSVTGGSDDHSALNIARVYTEVPGATDLPSFLAGIAEGRSRDQGLASTPHTFAHNLYSIAYQFYKNKLGFNRYVDKDVFLKVIDRFLEPGPHGDSGLMFKLQAALAGRGILKRQRSKPGNLQDMVRLEAERLILDDPELVKFAKSGANNGSTPPDDAWFDFVNRAANRVCTRFGDHLLDHLSGANVFDIFGTVGSAGALYTMLAPYFVAYTLFTKDRRFCRQVAERFQSEEANRAKREAPIKVAHFTDTFYEVNGVAITLQLQAKLAVASGKHLTIVTCDENRPDAPGIKNFKPIGVYSLPEYEEQRIFYPPIMEMLDYVFEEGFTHIHSATPGPLGMTALLFARILKLPIYGTYHTALPQYANTLTGDEEMEALMWKFMIWYYNQMDLVYVPSKATGDELVAKGVEPSKIILYPRGVDTNVFHPEHKNGYLNKLGLNDGPHLLYVGRVSKEKNLHLLAHAFKELSVERPEASLVVVGDGPYLDEMKALMSGTRTVFTGYKDGAELSAIYASCDLFVFPSTTDTFGNVVLEAQSSGLPIIVTDQGGPQENIHHGVTGLIVKGEDGPALLEAMRQLTQNPDQLKTMGQAARASMEERTFEKAFDQTWDLYSTPPTPNDLIDDGRPKDYGLRPINPDKAAA